MKADPKRKPGSYWVRFEGAVIVAEWMANMQVWAITGSSAGWNDSEVCELLSKRLEPPKK